MKEKADFDKYSKKSGNMFSDLLLYCLRFLLEYQALDLDIQKEKTDIQSACRGNPLTPYYSFRQSVEQEIKELQQEKL